MANPLSNLRLFFCFNQVSYTICSSLAKRGDVIIHSEGIETCEADYLQFRYGTVSKAFGKALILSGLVKRLFIPHQKFLTPFLLTRAQAYTDYVDDGLDTLRKVPRNFPLGVPHTSHYFTFSDYGNLPAWFPPERIVHVCRLRNVVMERGRLQFQVPQEDFVVIESANLPLPWIVEKIQGRSVCYLEHRNPTKRLLNVPEHWRRERFGSMTESVLISGYQGIVICGDSMSAVILSYAQRSVDFKLIYVGDEISIIPNGRYELGDSDV